MLLRSGLILSIPLTPPPLLFSLQTNLDPYGEGWMMKIKLSNKGDLDEMMDAAAYEKHSEH